MLFVLNDKLDKKNLILPSKLYKAYWLGRYVERVDSITRSLLSALHTYKNLKSEEPLISLADSLGIEFTKREKFLEVILHGDVSSSVLYAVRNMRTNAMGLGIDRLVRESNILVIAVEERPDLQNIDEVIKHANDVVAAINNLGRVIDEEIAPPKISDDTRQNQTRHQQQ
ncbi:alpha-E domain-containing protein [Nitrosopumilus oxyclinae]|uniref:alpha-E domain-containing protein n=1 Tax=Nitrosopumilus oxyclinae TaxID=1959104 RepID=UPI0015CBB42A|nr:alpha-E domain-containing protein [Nitrosopumilus oxyclinae]